MPLATAIARIVVLRAIAIGVEYVGDAAVAVEEMTDLLRAAQARLSAGQLWVNPDCGLKTRKWPETKAALANMVEAARAVRRAVGAA